MENVFKGIKEVLCNEKFVEDTIRFAGNDCPAIYFECFLLFYSKGIYYVSFRINSYKIEEVAHYTLILAMLYMYSLEIFNDSFIEEKTAMLYFGDAAYNKYEDHVHDTHGVIKCGMCENIVRKEVFNYELGYCQICEKYLIPNLTLH